MNAAVTVEAHDVEHMFFEFRVRVESKSDKNAAHR